MAAGPGGDDEPAAAAQCFSQLHQAWITGCMPCSPSACLITSRRQLAVRSAGASSARQPVAGYVQQLALVMTSAAGPCCRMTSDQMALNQEEHRVEMLRKGVADKVSCAGNELS
jgi:hypothetical protein